jgi:hypothetical protein
LLKDEAKATSSSWLNGKSVTRRGNVTTSIGGEAAPKRGKRGDDASWTNANLTEPKMKKIHTVDSAGTNGRI